MEGIWSKQFPYKKYSNNTMSLFEGMVDNVRQEFKKEYSHVLSQDPRHVELYDGMRFRSDDQLAWVLQSNVSEEDFLKDSKHYLFRVLLGACETDYYYTYEKEW